MLKNNFLNILGIWEISDIYVTDGISVKLELEDSLGSYVTEGKVLLAQSY